MRYLQRYLELHRRDAQYKQRNCTGTAEEEGGRAHAWRAACTAETERHACDSNGDRLGRDEAEEKAEEPETASASVSGTVARGTLQSEGWSVSVCTFAE